MSKKSKAKIDTDHPIHLLYVAASTIVQAAHNAGKDVGEDMSRNRQIVIPVWVDSDPIIKVTIECGVETTAEYAIFKAQNK
jgi:hypothetical protein